MEGIAICGGLPHLVTSGVHSVRHTVYEAHQPIHISSIPSMRPSASRRNCPVLPV